MDTDGRFAGVIKATHGVLEPRHIILFEMVMISQNVGDSVDFTLTLFQDYSFSVDFGDGLIVNYSGTGSINVTGQTVSTSTITIRSGSPILKFINNANVIISADIIKSSTLEDVTLIFANKNLLTNFNITDASNIASASNAFFDTSIANFPAGDWSSCNNMTSFLRNVPALLSVGSLNTKDGGVYLEMFRDSVNLACITDLNTVAGIDNTNIFFNTPGLAAPNSTEQTNLESAGGFNYVNTGSCP